MRDADSCLGRSLLDAHDRIVDRLDAVAHVVDLSLAGKLEADGGAHDVRIPLADRHLHGQPSRRCCHDERHVADAAHGHLHRARNRRSGKRQHIDLLAHVLELLLVLDAEALLLVDDDKAKVVGVHIVREQAVRADEDIDRALSKALQGLLLPGRRDEAGEHLDVETEGRKPLIERLVVLLGENRRGAEHHDLAGGAAALEGRTQGHLGLAEAHIAAEEPVHRLRRLHIGLDVCNRRLLVRRQRIGEACLHLLLLRGIRREGIARDACAPRIEVHEVEGKLLCALPGFAGRTRPVCCIEAREARSRTIRADIAGDPVHLLERHIELVAACIFEEEVVTLASCHFLAHDLGEEGDAVRCVHDIVSRLERERDRGGIDLLDPLRMLCHASREI